MLIVDPAARDVFFALARGETVRGPRGELRDRGFINWQDQITPKGVCALMRNGFEGKPVNVGPSARQLRAQEYRRAGIMLCEK